MKWLIYIFISLLLLIPVISLEVPKEDNTQLIQNIHQEHSNTRKYFSDELARNRNQFFKEIDERATYYEETVDNMLTTLVWKLSLLWAGVVFFIVAFNNVIRMILEKKRFKKLKESIKAEIMTEMKIMNPTKVQQQVQKPIFKDRKGYNIETDELFTIPTPIKEKKKSWLQKRKEKKKYKEYNKLLEKQNKLKKDLGLDLHQPSQPQQNAEVNYKNSFEVEY